MKVVQVDTFLLKPTVELELSSRISRLCHLLIIKVPVQMDGYLTLVANHRTTNPAKIIHYFNMKTLPDSMHFVIPSSPRSSQHRAR